MVKIYAFMAFWSDNQENSTRLRNVNYCWPRLQNLSNYINSVSQDHQFITSLFDFSENQQIPESIHIPYPKGTYKRTEKLNRIIFNYAQTYDPNYLMIIDSDVFFAEKDFPEIYKLISNINDYHVITFDMAKLDHFDTISTDEINRDNANWSFAYGGEKNNGPFAHGSKGGLGGVCLVDYNLVSKIGGFNEKYTVWGGEDGEIITRMCEYQDRFRMLSVNTVYGFHLPHFCDYNNQDYWKPGKNLRDAHGHNV